MKKKTVYAPVTDTFKINLVYVLSVPLLPEKNLFFINIITMHYVALRLFVVAIFNAITKFSYNFLLIEATLFPTFKNAVLTQTINRGRTPLHTSFSRTHVVHFMSKYDTARGGGRESRGVHRISNQGVLGGTFLSDKIQQFSR